MFVRLVLDVDAIGVASGSMLLFIDSRGDVCPDLEAPEKAQDSLCDDLRRILINLSAILCLLLRISSGAGFLAAEVLLIKVWDPDCGGIACPSFEAEYVGETFEDADVDES